MNETDFVSYADDNTSYVVGNKKMLLSIYKMYHLHFSNGCMTIE